MNRREFLSYTALSSWMLTLHGSACFAHPASDTATKASSTRPHLIQDIHLLTSTPLDVMRDFYQGKLGLPTLSLTSQEVRFQVGASTLSFTHVETSAEPPWYHFAFNIPENKLLKARDWHLQHSDFIPTPPRARDPKFPDDVRHFPHWNAHSLFFWDPAGNLVEYIARHELSNQSQGKFSPKDFLNISEIAFVVDQQELEAKRLHQELGIPVYPKQTNFWWAMGDAMGLLLCIPKRLWGENTATPKRFAVHPTVATIRGQQAQQLDFAGFPYQVNVKKS